jgi:hypothetical protein
MPSPPLPLPLPLSLPLPLRLYGCIHGCNCRLSLLPLYMFIPTYILHMYACTRTWMCIAEASASVSIDVSLSMYILYVYSTGPGCWRASTMEHVRRESSISQRTENWLCCAID